MGYRSVLSAGHERPASASREPSARQVTLAAALVFVVAALVLGVQAFARDASPDDDPAFYLNVARSLAAGRGLSVDAVQFTLMPTEPLPVASNSYWMPLTSLLIAPFLALGASAALPIVLWSALAAALVCVFAARLLGSAVLGAACGLAFADLDLVRVYGTCADSTVLFAGFVLGVFLLYARLCDDRRRGVESAGPALALGALAGLAALTRSDGLVSVPLACLLAAGVARWRGLVGPSLRQTLLAAAGWILVLLPWSLRCLATFGRPWNPAGGKTLHFTDYTQLFSRAEPQSGSTLVAQALADPLTPLARTTGTIAEIAQGWVGFLHPALGLLALLGLVLLLRERRPARSQALVAVCQLIALTAVYALLVGALGFNWRNWASLTPLILVATLEPVAVAIERLPGLLAPAARAGVLLLALGHATLIGGAHAVAGVPPLGPPSPRADLQAIEQALVAHGAAPREPVITMRPHLLLEATGRPAHVLPSDGLAETLTLARELHTRWILLLPQKTFATHPAYAELAAIHRGALHPALELVATSGDLQLYRVRDPAVQPK